MNEINLLAALKSNGFQSGFRSDYHAYDRSVFFLILGRMGINVPQAETSTHQETTQYVQVNMSTETGTSAPVCRSTYSTAVPQGIYIVFCPPVGMS